MANVYNQTTRSSALMPPPVPKAHTPHRLFGADTCLFVCSLQHCVIQGMLDFDYLCGQEKLSMDAMVYLFGGHHILFTSVKNPDVNVIANLVSSRSVYLSTLEVLIIHRLKVWC